MSGTPPIGNWNYPTKIHLGCGRRRQLPELCGAQSINSPLIVTDPGISGLPVFQEILDCLADSGLPPDLFDQVKGNPTGSNVEEGVEAFRDGDHDGVIAIGGGSALDAAKAIALAGKQSITLWECEDHHGDWFNASDEHIVPVVAIPTTAGTGSEVGRAALITHEQQQVKKIIWHPKLMPAAVVLDAELTAGLPAHLTAATGMDALSHNLEAWCAPGFHPMAEGIALQGMKLIKDNLPRAVERGDDLEARSNMLVASSMGATAFQRGLGGMHALAHPLGAIYDAHHGLLNAILMPYVLKANQSAITDNLSRAAAYLGLAPGFAGFLDWVLGLREELEIPNSLKEIGIPDNEAERIGAMAIEDPSAGGNPIPLNAGQYASIFTAAVNGEL